MATQATQAAASMRTPFFKASMIPLWAGFTSLIAAFLYGGAQLDFSAGDYLFWGAATAILAGWLARKSLGAPGLASGVIGGHVAAVCLLHPAPVPFLLHFSAIVALPLLASWLVKSWRLPLWLAGAAFATALTADLLDYLNASRFLYETQPPPSLDLRLKPPPAPRPRVVATPLISNYRSDEGMRYPELLYRVPAAFSSFSGSAQYYQADPFSEEFLAAALSRKQWKGFLVSRNYWRLAHSDIDPALLKSIFAVGDPPFQLKNCAVSMEDGGLLPFFSKAGKDQSLAWLRSCVFVAPEHEKVLSGWLRPADAAAPAAPPALRYSLVYNGHNGFTLDIESPGGVLYWADGYDQGWLAEINGLKAKLARVNINFKALALPPGKSRVRLTYRPTAFLAGLWIYYGTAAAALGTALWLSLSRES